MNINTNLFYHSFMTLAQAKLLNELRIIAAVIDNGDTLEAMAPRSVPSELIERAGQALIELAQHGGATAHAE